MATIAKNPIKKHYKGMPCMMGESVMRIVGESEKGSWGYINGEHVPSIVLVSTPHGTVIESGRFFLDEITEDGMNQLLEYEKDASTGTNYYANKLTPEEISINPYKNQGES